MQIEYKVVKKCTCGDSFSSAHFYLFSFLTHQGQGEGGGSHGGGFAQILNVQSSANHHRGAARSISSSSACERSSLDGGLHRACCGILKRAD